jgi:integrase
VAYRQGESRRRRSGHGRTVDMSQQLTATLRRLQVQRKQEKLHRGWQEMPTWVFINSAGSLMDKSRVRKSFTKILKLAKLPLHFSPHCLRHTFASLLLQAGQSPSYVQRQLGHASIKLTVDTYGKWLPMGNKAAVDGLDDPVGSETVGDRARVNEADAEPLETLGEPSGIRTLDPLIKSPSEDQPETA